MTKNKRETTLMIIGAIVLVASIIILWLMKPKGVLVTENIEDYNTADYPIREYLFMDEIPEKAEVIRYSYYNYGEVVRDYYLELKFETSDDLTNYMSELERCILNNIYPYTIRLQNNGLFIEESNPYNSSYTDLLCTYYGSTSSNITKTGYAIIEEDDGTIVNYCRFGMISYSYEDLILIQNVCYGSYRDTVHHHTPEYFKRFNVPTDKELERAFVLN